MNRMVDRGRMSNMVGSSNGGGCMVSRMMAASSVMGSVITVVGPVMVTGSITGNNADKSSDNQKL